MDLGGFSSGALTGLREGVEAALIISILCAYLARTGNRRHFPRVFGGAGGAAVLSAILGIALFVTVGSFQAPYEQLFEAITLLAAAGVVTWMLFWMRRQAASVKGELQAAVDRALGDRSGTALAALAFVAVLREGIETSLFLVGQATSAAGGASSVLVGALVGLAIAGVLGVGFYHGSRRINLGTFFRWTGIALVFIAGGLVAKAAHELIEISVITFGNQILFDLSAILPNDPLAGNLLGQFLHVLFGYTATPELTTFVAWLAYIVVVLGLFLRPVRRVSAASGSTAPARP
ncbi:MAG: high-affinity iron transporter [Chloroflexota bacterium]|jgi:high-affinity iron transporter|nr:high-affinity iron transporter [Chloroflexota bacterium]